MSGLRPPPKVESSSRILLRIVVLIVLLLCVGVIVWSAVINQRIDLTETLVAEDLELHGAAEVDGMTINVVQEGTGDQAVVLLHDFDVAGNVLWDAVVAQLGGDVTVLRVDLPGMGLSTRLPQPGSAHTVGAMTEVVSQVVSERLRGQTPVFAGVGLGGEIAAEMAVVHPDQVSGVVLVDVDFYQRGGWLQWAERLPFVGTAMAYAFEGGGPFAQGKWAPNCDSGGWCPTQGQSEARDQAEQIVGTTDSIVAFRKTPASSIVPSRLGEISVPTVFVWSSDGAVSKDSVEETVTAIPGATLAEVDAWKAHLDAPGDVADAIRSVRG